jgi:hypothetical protein
MSSVRRLTRTMTGALVVTALAAPAASARPLYDNPGRPSEPAPTVTRTIDEGFDVGSAAIGAGGAAAVLLLTAAGAAAMSHRRHPIRLAAER